MAITLNKDALAHARRLVQEGKVVRDERDDWSEHAPDAEQENRFIDRNGWGDYADWHLGRDTDESAETKGRFSFPYGDFTTVHRCGVLALESRAAQFDHDEIATAAKNLLALIDDGPESAR